MTLLRGWVDALPAESPLHDDLAALRVIRAGSTLLAGPSSELYLGSSQDDVFDARAGQDLLDGGHGDDLLYAGEGNDAYTSDPDHPSKSRFALTPIIFSLPLGREDRSARSNSKIRAGMSRCIRGR
jgi:Ca2+-binding RTX toxin-like protein